MQLDNQMEVALKKQEAVSGTTPSVAPIGRILVAIDGSQSADNALQIAAQIAQKYSSEIDLIHVGALSTVEQSSREFTSGGQENALSTKDESGEISVSIHEDELLSERKKTLESKGIKTREISVPSNESLAGEEIVKQSKAGEYNLVALGSRGLGRARSFFLGSVSKKVVNESKCSVLVSKTGLESIRRILLAYDGSDDSKRALVIVGDLAKKFGGVVNVIGVISEPMVTAEIDVRGAIDRLDKEMNYYGDQAKSMLRELGANCEEAKVVGAEKISSAISKEAEEGFYDIVAMGSRGWGRARTLLLGSVAMGVLDSSKANVLIVK